jgi:hypothetical protein
MSDYKVEMDGDCMSDLYVCFHGPKESAPFSGAAPHARVLKLRRTLIPQTRRHLDGLLAAPCGPNRRTLQSWCMLMPSG